MFVGDWEVDPKLNELRQGEKTIRLSPLAMDVLLHLAEHAGDVVDTETLIERNWPANKGSDNSLYKVISELRRSFDDADRKNRKIQSISKRGYSLTLAVRESDAAPSNLGQTTDYQTLLDQSLKQGQQRLETRNYSLAVRHFKVVLGLCQQKKLVDLTLETEMNILIGECLLQEQGTDTAQPYFVRARELSLETNNQVQHVRALLGLSGNLQPVITEEASNLRHQLQMTYLALPKTEIRLRLRVRARVISYTFPMTNATVVEASEVVVAARELRDSDLLTYSLLAYHECLRSLGRVEEQLEVSEEIFSLSSASNDRDLVIVGYLRRISDLLVLGQIKQAQILRVGMEALKPKILFQDELSRIDACFSMMQGELDEAEQFATSISFLESGYLLMQYLQLITIARARGASEQILPLVESVADEYKGLPAVSVYLALLYADCEQFDASRRELSNIEGGLDGLQRDITWHAMLAAASEIAYETNDKVLAAQVLENLRPYNGYHLMFTTICYFGAATYHTGLMETVLGNEAAAKAQFEESLRQHEEICSAHFIAKSKLQLGISQDD